jgi:4-carboxymuconolactone decarboxylase
MTPENFQKGLALRHELSGDRVVDEALKDPTTLPSLAGPVTEFAFGAVWSCPDLDRRSRSILNIGCSLWSFHRERVATLLGA